MDPLPPFGIRGLRAGLPFSVIQIDETQYDAQVASHPNTILSYIDDDDGENVTVGSGLELRQRLEDQPSQTAPLASCFDSIKDRYENRFIHLFDVQRTPSTRYHWLQHQRNYNQAQSQYEKIQIENDGNASVSSIDISSVRSGQIKSTPSSSEQKDVSLVQQQDTTGSPLVSSLFNVIPDLVDNLATLLHTTSETLRRAAEKSRDSNTSPVEDVLQGMGNIVTEIGNFGLTLLEKIEDKPSETKPVDNGIAKENSPSLQLDATDDKVDDNDVSSTVSVNGSVESLPSELSFNRHDVDTTKTDCTTCVKRKLQCRKSSDGSDACHNCATLGETCSLKPMIFDRSTMDADDLDGADIEIPHNTVDNLLRATYSILDQDTDDADFSRRYPPLMSLRRATTVAGLHDRFSRANTFEPKETNLNRHNSWGARYPHRPSPYVLDAETQRRRDFARNCFPDLPYTPGPGTREMKLSAFIKPDRKTHKAERLAHKRSSLLTPSFHPESIEPQPALDDKNTRSDSKLVTEPSIDTSFTTSKNPFSPAKPSLPGAWPEPLVNSNQQSGPAEESSGAFFHRMTRDHPSRTQKLPSDNKERERQRPVRHRSLSQHRPSKNPFSDLNRSQTVSSVTNPASRLNGPFDPLYPVIPSAEPSPLKLDSLKAQKPATTVSFPYYSPPSAPAPPRSLLPPRPFSPVWEDHLKASDDHTQNTRPKSIFDRNGESSSMYSPPPRHMRSVPNFGTARMSLTIDKAKDTTNFASASHSKQQAVSTADKAEQPQITFPIPGPSLIYPPPRPDQLTFVHQTGTTAPYEPPFAWLPLDPNAAPPVPKPVVEVTVQDESNPADVSDDVMEKCLCTLRDMGYGLDDHNLRSRLHIYAEAAGGDVMEAVEMIEEDKKAHFNSVVQKQLDARNY